MIGIYEALLLTFAALVVNTVGSEVKEIHESTVLRPGVEYRYTYKAQALSGSSVVSVLQSGLALHCEVRLQVLRDGSSVLQMEDIRIYKVEDVMHAYPGVMLNQSQMILIPRDQGDVMEEFLHKPVRFRYQEGEIRTLQTSRHDDYWSINVKKGLLSLLQLKLNQKSSHISPDSYEFKQLFESVYSHAIGYNPWPIKQLDKTFSVIETDINGDCETKYSIGTNPRGTNFLSSAAEKVVIKVKNLEHCLNKNSYDIGLFSGMFHYSTERPLIEPTIQTEYVVTGDRFHFLIKSAQQEAKYHFSPYGPEGGHVSTHVNQQLTLISTVDYDSPIAAETSILEEKGLKMEVPQASLTPQRKPSDAPEQKQYVQLVENQLDEFVSHVTDDDPAVLMQLSLVLREVPRRELLALLKKYLTPKPPSGDTSFLKKRDVLLDTLMTVPSTDVALTLIEMIRDGRMRGRRVPLTISVLSLVTSPNSDVIVALLTLYREWSVSETADLQARRSILLGVGTLTNRMIHLMKKNSRPIQQVILTVENVSNHLQRMLSQTHTDSEKITIIKAMGNAGVKSLMNPLASTLKTKTESISVRVQAAYALRKLARIFKSQIQPDLLDIFMNKKEDEKIRIAAFKILMSSNVQDNLDPNFVTLQIIVQNLRNEPSQQIRSFVYKTLINTASTTWIVPEVRNIVLATRRAIRQMKSIPVHFLDSKSLMWQHYTESADFGVVAVLDYLKSKRGILPDQLVLNLRSQIFGNLLDLFELGVEGSGLETVLRRLMGPYGLIKDILTQKVSMLQLLKPLSRPFMDAAADKIRSMLHLKSVRRAEEDDIEALIQLKLLDQELQYWQIHGGQADELFKENIQYISDVMEGLSNGQNLDILRTFSSVSNSHIVPTSMGIPLSLNISVAAVLRLEGMVKARNFPTWTQWMLEGTRSLTKPLLLQFDVQSTINCEVFGEMALDMRWIKYGTALKFTFQGHIPANGEISFDYLKNSLATTFSTPEEAAVLSNLKIQPMTCFFYFPTTIANLPFRFELKEIKSPSAPGTLNPKIPLPLSDLGLVILVEGHFTKCANPICQLIPLYGTHEIKVLLTPLSHVNKKVFLEVIFETDSSSPKWQSTNHKITKVFESDIDASHSHHHISQSLTRSRFLTEPRGIRIHLKGGVAGTSKENIVGAVITWLRSPDKILHEFIGKLHIENRELFGPVEADLHMLIRSPWNVTNDAAFSQTMPNTSVLAFTDIKLSGNYLSNSTFQISFSDLDGSRWKSYVVGEGFTVDVPDIAQRYRASIRLHPVSRSVDNLIYGAISTVKHVWYPYLHIGNTTLSDRGNMTVLLELIPNLHKMNMIMMTSLGTSVVLGAPYKEKKSLERELNVDESSVISSTAATDTANSNSTWHSVCRTTPDRVITYDGVSLLLANSLSSQKRKLLTGSSLCCEHLLAHDCTKRELFSVSASFCDNNVSLSVIIPQYYISVGGYRPTNNTHHHTLIVNGETVELNRTGGKITLTEFPHDQHSRVVCVIQRSQNSITLSLSELGMTVFVRDYEILTKLSPASLLQGQVCGLCGDFDYDSSNDLRDLKGHEGYSSPQEFILDMTLPSRRCDISEYKNLIYQIYNDDCIENITMKIERLVHGGKEICYSMRPVSVCQPSCSVVSSIQAEVQFICLPTSDKKAVEIAENVIRNKSFDISLLKSNSSLLFSELHDNAATCQRARWH